MSQRFSQWFSKYRRTRQVARTRRYFGMGKPTRSLRHLVAVERRINSHG